MAKNEIAVAEGGEAAADGVNVSKPSPFKMLQNAEAMRSVIIILCLAIMLVAALIVIFWGREPVMRPLGSYSEQEELNAVIAYLKQHQYEYRFDEIRDGKKNTVSVTVDDYDRIVEGLTVDGITSSAPRDGSQILLEDSSFGVSARKEEERLKYAREQQIASMLQHNRKISDAKVLLAIPPRNVFTREARHPSAAVTVKVAGSGTLSPSEVDAIVDSVAAAVQGLDPSRVTLIDQNGRLLNSGSMDAASQAMRRATELQSQKENQYKLKIEEILTPILGYNNFTPMVAVAIDNVDEEKTSQTYNNTPTIRSEQVSEELNSSRTPSGVPGAATNQPPANAQLPEVNPGDAAATGVRTNGINIGSQGNSSRSATRNYEVDTTISHSQKKSGSIERLSVSVAVNYKEGTDKDGNPARVPRTQEELAKIADLLRNGLGIDEARGDTLAVHTVKFFQQEAEDFAETPFYDRPAFEKALRIGISALIIIAILMFLVRPLVMNLINRKSPDEAGKETDLDNGLALEGDDDLNLLVRNEDGPLALYDIKNGQIVLPELHKDEDLLKAVRALVANEPDLAAQVVKDWVSVNEVK